MIEAKKKSWKNFCKPIKKFPKTVKLCKILTKIRTNAGDNPSLRWHACVGKTVHFLEESFSSFQKGIGRQERRDTLERARTGLNGLIRNWWWLSLNLIKFDELSVLLSLTCRRNRIRSFQLF